MLGEKGLRQAFVSFGFTCGFINIDSRVLMVRRAIAVLIAIGCNFPLTLRWLDDERQFLNLVINAVTVSEHFLGVFRGFLDYKCL